MSIKQRIKRFVCHPTMKRPYPLILFVLATGFCGCLKRSEKNVNQPCSSGCIVMNIHIGTGDQSLQSLGDATIELGWSKPATPLGDPGRLIATGKTNSAGDLQLSFSPEAKELAGGRFYINASKGNDHLPAMVTFYEITSRDTTINARMHLPSKATLRMIYTGFAPVASGDIFQSCPTFRSYGSEGFAMQMKTPTGEDGSCFFLNTEPFEREERIVQTAGDQYTIIETLRIKDGVRTTLTDSIFIPKGETKVVQVAY